MKITSLPFEDIPFFSKRDKAFQANQKELMSFVPYSPCLNDLKRAILERKKFTTNRDILTHSLNEQYSSIDISKPQKENIEALHLDNTYTVTTAHQPSLVTGPFYFILKICSTIHLAKKLSEEQKCKIVPVFIIGGEDHDFDEINHTHIFSKKITWERESQGAVGRLNLEGFDEQVIQPLQEVLGNSVNAEYLKSLFLEAIESTSTYGEFTFKLVNRLFAEYGLLVLSFDQPSFKRHFIPLIKKEILESASVDLVHASQKEIVSRGFKKQAHARDINFFYFTNNKRLRIGRKDENTFEIIDTDITFNHEDMIKEIESHPDRFSPNVIMRPIFQEFILPNIAYIGGGGELAYWMERHSQFELFETFFPVLIRRNSAMYIAKKQWDSLNNLGLSLKDMMKEEEALIKDYVRDHSKHSISLEKIKQDISNIYNELLGQTSSVDKSLDGKVKALEAQQIKELDKLEQRLIKKLKSNQEVNINKIRKVRNQLFPGNGLQERKTNFMEFYLKEGNTFIPKLIDHCDPLNKSFSIFIEE